MLRNTKLLKRIHLVKVAEIYCMRAAQNLSSWRSLDESFVQLWSLQLNWIKEVNDYYKKMSTKNKEKQETWHDIFLIIFPLTVKILWFLSLIILTKWLNIHKLNPIKSLNLITKIIKHNGFSGIHPQCKLSTIIDNFVLPFWLSIIHRLWDKVTLHFLSYNLK